jgi:hypothetical protein
VRPDDTSMPHVFDVRGLFRPVSRACDADLLVWLLIKNAASPGIAPPSGS